MRKIRHYPMTALTIVSIIGIMYLYWFYCIDGVYVNKPFIFIHNPYAIQTEKTSYHSGEMVSIKVSFCKTRPATSVTNWSIVDGRIIFLPSLTNTTLPVGCYFDKFVDLAVIPRDEHLTGHLVHFEGASTVILSQGREVKYNYKTTSFMIK